MSRLMFGAPLSALLAAPLTAQEVPGRDLLQFPVATIAEAQALATFAGDGLWNPAAGALESGQRFRGTVSALTTPADQGVSIQMLGLAAAVPGRTTVVVSVLRASVSDILRTEDSPQTIGSEVPYSTLLISAGAARRQDRITVGLAVRHRAGRLDDESRAALGIDAGVLADQLFGVHGRLGVSTFLWRPAHAEDERTTYSAAGDLRVFGRDAHHELRTGYAYTQTEGLSSEHYLFAGGRWGGWEARAGVVDHAGYGYRERRLRIGAGLHRAAYTVGIGREENGAGLGPSYQFTLTATIK